MWIGITHISLLKYYFIWIINIIFQVIDTIILKDIHENILFSVLTKYQQFWSQMMPWLKNNFENIFEIKQLCVV